MLEFGLNGMGTTGVRTEEFLSIKRRMKIVTEELGGGETRLEREPVSSASASEVNREDLSDKLEQYLPLVKVIVAKMRPNLPSYADIEELSSAGVIGLISAIERFDASRGYCFETYASIRVRGAILDELRKLDIMPRSARSKFRRLNQAVENLEQRLGRAPSDEEICQELEMPLKSYFKLRADTQPFNLLFLDQGSDAEVLNRHELVADEDQQFPLERLENEELMELVKEKIKELPRRQKIVLALYYYEGMRLAEIGRILGVSEARISQLRTQALKTLRKFLNRMTRG